MALLWKVQTCEFAKPMLRRIIVGTSRFFRRVVCADDAALALRIDRRSKSALTSLVNALEPGRRRSFSAGIPNVLLESASPQVATSIVESIPISVVNVNALWWVNDHAVHGQFAASSHSIEGFAFVRRSLAREPSVPTNQIGIHRVYHCRLSFIQKYKGCFWTDKVSVPKERNWVDASSALQPVIVPNTKAFNFCVSVAINSITRLFRYSPSRHFEPPSFGLFGAPLRVRTQGACLLYLGGAV